MNAVAGASGTTRRLGSAESPVGVTDGVTATLADGLAAALALATRVSDAPLASPALNANATIDTSPNRPRMTQVTTHNRGRGCENAVKRAGASRSRRRRNPLRPRGAACHRSCSGIGRG